jgi:type III secretion protein L
LTELPTRPFARIIRAEQAESWIDGYAFLEQAKAEAEAIRASATEEVAKAREAGRLEGRAAGEAEASALLMRTHTDVDRYLESIEPQLAVLAMEIVQRVLGHFDEVDLVARAAYQALETLRDESAVVVNVAPDLVQEVQQRLSAFGAETASVRVAADRHLSGRQCILTTPSTSIDVGVDTQLEAIQASMGATGRSNG